MPDRPSIHPSHLYFASHFKTPFTALGINGNAKVKQAVPTLAMIA
jgi:hypothetical protein